MGLFETLKSFLGFADESTESGRSTEANVTVERKPDAESEHAVKGTAGADEQAAAETPSEEGTDAEAESSAGGPGAAAETGTDETESAPEPADEAEGTAAASAEESESTPAESETTEPDDGPSPSVREINGIGPTYAERLAEIGIETVADLRKADAEAVAEAAETSEMRVDDWLSQAEEF